MRGATFVGSERTILCAFAKIYVFSFAERDLIVFAEYECDACDLFSAPQNTKKVSAIILQTITNTLQTTRSTILGAMSAARDIDFRVPGEGRGVRGEI
jgi:hypothetical protein